MNPKIEITYTNEFGDVSTASFQGEAMTRKPDVIDWFLNTGICGIGFSAEGD